MAPHTSIPILSMICQCLPQQNSSGIWTDLHHPTWHLAVPILCARFPGRQPLFGQKQNNHNQETCWPLTIYIIGMVQSDLWWTPACIFSKDLIVHVTSNKQDERSCSNKGVLGVNVYRTHLVSPTIHQGFPKGTHVMTCSHLWFRRLKIIALVYKPNHAYRLQEHCEQLHNSPPPCSQEPDSDLKPELLRC